MQDIDGNKVNVGDTIKVLVVRDDIPLAEDEKPHVDAMLNNNYEIEAFVNNNTQVSVSYWIKEKNNSIYGGLYLYPKEFRLMSRKNA